MRLTLRTLLAYLDDTLEPAQAKLIGQKVAESETAQELMARIRQVTRRRRITTPPPTGPGARIDPNTIAEYLDNVLSGEQLNEVEQVALASDVHLAEIAACHQILTLVLGEPALVPPTAKQRMYGVVKGPEAIPFRKPPAPEPEMEYPITGREEDETLRLGMPALSRGGSWKNPLLMVGGGIAVGLLLALAIWQVLRGPGEREVTQVPAPVAQAQPAAIVDKKAPEGEPWPAPVKVAAVPQVKKEETPPEVKAEPPPKKEPEKPAPVPEVKPGPASGEQQVVGQLQTPPPGEPAMLLQATPDGSAWKRVDLKRPDVYSGRPLVSLPGSRSVVDLKKGVRLTFWGNLREQADVPPIFESVGELHTNDSVNADFTLRRGRIVVANLDGKPARVVVRFENPAQAGKIEQLDLTLKDKGTEVMIDRWGSFVENQTFFKDPKDPERFGPLAQVGLIVTNGDAEVKYNDVTFGLQPPPAKPLLLWNSLKGQLEPITLPKMPDSVLANPPLPQGVDAARRTEMLRARDDLSASLAGRALDVTLAGDVKSPDLAKRQLAVLSFAAVDDLPNLVDALDQDKFPDVRLLAIESLRQWMVANRDNTYKLNDLLEKKYRKGEVQNIIKLLHFYTAKERSQPETYEALIDYLTNPLLVIRELGAWHLKRMVPAGANIPYDAAADSSIRERAHAQWRTLIPSGQLPPQPAAPKKKG